MVIEFLHWVGLAYKALLWVAVPAVLSALITGRLIKFLSNGQFGKTIREDGPDHASKAGTPTMGGIGMLLIVLSALIASKYFVDTNLDPAYYVGRRLMPSAAWAPILGVICFAVLGLTDDLAGLARRSGKKELGIGLKALHMLALQFALAFCIAGFFAWAAPIHLPLLQEPLNAIGMLLSAIFLTIILVATANGANLSDGLDGLAAGLLCIAFASSAICLTLLPQNLAQERILSLPSSIAGTWGESSRSDLWSTETENLSQLEQLPGGEGTELELLLLRLAMITVALVAAGACLGFLYHNKFPAKVFMGNVASMGLGVTFAMIHILSGTWWLIPIIGAVFVAEVVSDLIQIGYFKYSGGKRVFRMAPLHHHYEKGGMPEQQVVRRFWAAGLLSGLAGIALTWFVV